MAKQQRDMQVRYAERQAAKAKEVLTPRQQRRLAEKENAKTPRFYNASEVMISLNGAEYRALAQIELESRENARISEREFSYGPEDEAERQRRQYRRKMARFGGFWVMDEARALKEGWYRTWGDAFDQQLDAPPVPKRTEAELAAEQKRVEEYVEAGAGAALLTGLMVRTERQPEVEPQCGVCGLPISQCRGDGPRWR